MVVAICLWLLFRRGSIADRARTDEDLLDSLGAAGEPQSTDNSSD